MNNVEIKCFLESAYQHSFAKAGEILNFAPQAVNKNVRTLERELNTDLFLRKKRSIELTEAGEYYFSLFSSASASLRRMLHETRSQAEIKKNFLHLGLSDWLSPGGLVLDGIKHLRSIHHALRVDTVVLPAYSLLEQVQNHQIDLAFLSAAQFVEHRGLNVLPVRREHYRLIAPASQVPQDPTEEELSACFGLPLLLPSYCGQSYGERGGIRVELCRGGGRLYPPACIPCHNRSTLNLELMFPRYAAVVEEGYTPRLREDRAYRSFPLAMDAQLLCVWSAAHSHFIEDAVEEIRAYFQDH